MKLVVRKRACEMLPAWYYGYYYYSPLSDHTFFAVIPLNFVLRWLRLISRQWNIVRSRPPKYEVIETVELNELLRELYNQRRRNR